MSSTRTSAGQAATSVLSVVSVVAVVVALAAFFLLDGADPEPQAGPSPDTAETADRDNPAPPRAEPGRDATRDEQRRRPDRQEPQDARRPAERQTGRPSERPAGRQTPEPTQTAVAVPNVYVEVYNNTSISGLAGSKAATLQDAGWQVVGVDNWRGNIPESTVYYPEGLAEEAQQLASVLGIGRTHPAVSPMKFDRLTVILNTDAA